MPGRYVLNIDGQIQLNKSALNKVTRDLTRAIKGVDSSPEFDPKRIRSIQQIRSLVADIQKNSSKIGPNVTKGLRKELADLFKFTRKGTKDSSADFILVGARLNEITKAYREAKEAAKELADEQQRSVRNRKRFGDLRQNVGLNRRKAVTTLRNLRSDIKGAGLSSVAETLLLDEVNKAGRLTKNRRNRTKLRQEVIPQLRRNFKELRDEEKKEADRNTRAAAITRERRDKQNRNSELQRKARETIRGLNESIQKSSIPFAKQVPLLDQFLGIDNLTGSKAGRNQLKNQIIPQIRQQYEDVRKATEDEQKKTDQINQTRRKRSKKQDARVEQQENVQGKLRKLSDRIQNSNIPFTEQTKLLSGFGAINAGTDSKAGRKIARQFIDDTKRQADDLIKVQNDADRKQKEADQKRTRARKARAKREREASEAGAFGFGKQSALAFRRFGAFTIAAGALFEVQQAFRSAISEAIVFQDQMVKIQQVTGKSSDGIRTFSDTITRLSTDLGVSSSDLANSAVIIAQAGFNLTDTGKALETLAAAQLTPSFNDLDNSTEALIALRSQFELTGDQFKTTFGSINAVSKAFAVESEDIATAIRKTGGAFKVAGGSVEELIALFTAVRSTTRESADTIAVGFRTIFGRLQRPAIIDDLKKFNIDLQENGNFVKPFEAIRKLNRGLAGISGTDPQFARIIEQVGGIRQISKVVPLIQQFGVAQTALNIAKLGSNSLDEDAAVRQKSLQVQLNKTKETFNEFVRSLGDNNTTLGKTFLTLNEGVQSLLRNLSDLSGFATPLGALLSVGALKTVGGFASGFAANINPFGNLKGGAIGRTGSALSAFGGSGTFRERFSVANKRFGGSLPLLAGIGAAGALFGAGVKIADVGQLTPRNRTQFAAGNALQSAVTGGAAGAIGGGQLGGVPGAIIGGALGAVVGGIIEFQNSLKLAAQEIKESDFKTVFDSFIGSLDFINTGKKSPIGQGAGIARVVSSIQNRQFSATGDFRTTLEGDTRQLSEKLVIFNQKLAENVNTMDEFKAAGGEASLAFLEANTALTRTDLESQVQDVIDSRNNESKALKAAAAVNEQFLSQANLINAFSSALKDAVDASEKLANGFDFAANTFAGGNGFTFSGRAGFNNVFERPGQVSNTRQFENASLQLEGLLGGALPGIAGTNAATSNVFKQLPSILADFASARPTGNIDDSIDKFIRQKLDLAAKGAPAGTLDPIIDSIVAAVTQEASGEGGQGKLIDKILENTVEFTQELIDKSGAEIGRKFQQDAANAIIDRFNRFAGQLGEVTEREIDLRNQTADNFLNFVNKDAEIAALRDPRGTLRPDIATAGALTAQRGLLTPFGAAGLSGNVGGLVARRRDARFRAIDLEQRIQNSESPKEFAELSKELAETQQEIGALTKAVEISTDTTARRSAIEQQLARAQQGRQQLTGGFGDFVFGNRQQRNDLNLGAILTQLVAQGGPAAFRQIANFPGDQNRELPGVLDNFLQKFSEVDLPGIGNLGELRRNIIEEELFPVFREKIAEQFAPRDRAANAGIIDAQARKAAQQGADQAVTDREQVLINSLADLAAEDFANQALLLFDIGQQNQELTNNLGRSLDEFIRELRNNVLVQQRTDQENKAVSQDAEVKAMFDQLNKFEDVVNAGGSKDNLENQTAVAFAQRIRDLDSSSTNVALANELQDFNKNIGSSPFGQAEVVKRVQNSQIGTDFISDFRTQGAKTAGILTGENLISQLGIKDTQKARDSVQKAIAEFEEKQKNDLLGAGPGDLFAAITGALSSQALTQQATEIAAREALAKELESAGPAIRNFATILSDLPVDQFKTFKDTITGLGNLKIDVLTHNLNELANALGDTFQKIKDIDAKIQQNQNAPPIALNEFNKSIEDFGGSSEGLVAAMNAFPRNVELAANHKIEVTFNGAQVLQNLSPALQELATNAANEAITKFAKENFPGGRALS